MRRRAAILFVGAVLALGLWSLTGYSATDDDDDKKAIADAQKDVLKLVQAMKNNSGDVKAQVEALKKKNEELKPIMWIYKPRNKGGLGVGKDGSGIENEFNRLSSTKSGPKTTLTPTKVNGMKNDLILAAQISRAIAEVTDLYPPKKDVDKWKGYTKDMRKGADELMEAAKSGDGAKIKNAIVNLNSSCTNCHSDFRND